MKKPPLVITTCKAFQSTSMPQLFESLLQQWEGGQIIVVWEGPELHLSFAKILHSDLECFEMTGPLRAAEVLDEPFLAIHDTCIAGPEFGKLAAESLARFNGVVGGNLPNYMHCCMGFFDPEFLRAVTPVIVRELHGKGKHAAVKFETEARLLELAGPRYQDMGWGIRDGIRHVDIYGTGNPRWERYFPGLDLWKYTLSATIEGVSETPII